MSINSILCHPQAESLASVDAADAYAAKHPMFGVWDALSDDQKETLLVTATRHVAACPLSAPPLSESLGLRFDQALPAPTERHDYRFGRAQSGTKTTLVDSGLKIYPDDSLNGGAVFFLLGAGQYQWATVDDFDGVTGTLTLSPELTDAPDETSRYLLIWPLSTAAQAAVIEQALYLAGGVNFRALDEAAMGVKAVSAASDGGGNWTMSTVQSINHLCHEARALLMRSGLLHFDQSVEVGRG
jgi:hypothetical protein